MQQGTLNISALENAEKKLKEIYDEEIALQVVGIIPDFSKEISFMITRLKESD